jgi:hypothetical protein
MAKVKAPAPRSGASAEGLRLGLKVTGGGRRPRTVDLEVPQEDLAKWLAGEARLPEDALRQFAETLFSSITGEAPR